MLQKRRASINDCRRASAVLFAAMILFGCKVETSSEVYLSDVVAAAATGVSEQVTTGYLLEMPTSDKCELHAEKIVELFKSEMVEVSDYKCVRIQLVTFYPFLVKPPLLVT